MTETEFKEIEITPRAEIIHRGLLKEAKISQYKILRSRDQIIIAKRLWIKALNLAFLEN